MFIPVSHQIQNNSETELHHSKVEGRWKGQGGEGSRHLMCCHLAVFPSLPVPWRAGQQQAYL